MIRGYSKLLKQVYNYTRFYLYWYFASAVSKAYTVITMALKREKRLYYLYSRSELVEVTAFNYLERVKVDCAEYALIKTVTPTGTSYTKAERF